MHERFWEFLAKYWADRINPEEKAEMERLLLEHPDHWLKTGLMQQIGWKPDQMLSDKQADRVADKALGNKSRPPSRKSGRRPFRVLYWRLVTVTVVILLVSSFLLLLTRSRPAGGLLWQRVTTAEGMKTTIQLADGSELWLNAGSALRYPNRFTGSTREVYLSGEAYVKIAPKKGSTFIIHTDDMDVSAPEAGVNVRDYVGEPYSEAVLVSGTLDVMPGGKRPQKIRLKPFQKIIVRKTRAFVDSPDSLSAAVTGDLMLQPAGILAGGQVAESAWRNDVFVSSNETMSQLADRIARWYGISVRVGDSALARQRFTVTMNDPSLPDLLRTLQTTVPFSYELKDDQLLVRQAPAADMKPSPR